MLTREKDPVQGENRSPALIVGDPDRAILPIHTLGELLPEAEGDGPAGGLLEKLTRDLIIIVEYGAVRCTLMQKNIFLCRSILLHGRVNIQMVGRKIGDHCDLRTQVHGHQLERGELQYGPIVRLHPVCVGQKGAANIAAYKSMIAGRF